MNKSYNRTGTPAYLRHLALAALLAGGAATAQGQALNYPAANVTKTAGTYTDLGTTGAAITTANTDDANSAEVQIGFPFTYNGAAQDRFILNTNGFIKLGSATGMTAPTVALYTATAQDNSDGTLLGTAAADVDLISPFNFDLTAGTGTTEYRSFTTGTAPNRVCTIQWKNVSDKAKPSTAAGASVASQYASFSFQVKLYETSNAVEFVYDAPTPGTTGAEDFKYCQVGLKGSGTGANQVVRMVKSSTTPWADANAQDGPVTLGATGAFNFRRGVRPTAGLTYRFSPVVANDGAVAAVYGFDKLTVPAGQPVNIRAFVRNAGNTALGSITVTLTVSAPNAYTTTQVVNSLAVGGSSVVSFPAVPMPAVGNNTVTVSIPNDGNNSNNSSSIVMATNATTTGFITAGRPPVSAFGFTAGATGNYFGAKVTYNSPRDITAVNAFFYNDPLAVGSSAYGVVIDATSGALLGRSADFVITAASLDQLHTFTLTSPVTVSAGDVIVGMATVAMTGAQQFFLMSVQSETPTRPGTFYTGSAVANPPVAPNPSLMTAGADVYKYMLEAVSSSPATCPAPTAVTATAASATSASVSFTGPTNGTGYTVVYVPQGTTPTATSPTSTVFTASPYTLPGLSASTCYDIYVRANCGATDRSTLAGPVTVCTPCVAPIITTFPYTQNFDVVGQQQPLPCGVVVTDNNADTYTWRLRSTATTQAGTVIQFANSAPNALVYNYNQDGTTPGDDWFYLPAMTLRAGSSYEVSFDYKTNAYDEGLEVKYGTAATPSGQTTLLYSNPNFQATSYATAGPQSTPAVARLTPATTGTYYIGFHAISLANGDYLAVDNVRVGLAGASASAALGRAVRVYPNPSADGVFSLQVRGANAGARGLGVEVVNTLGQVVYTGAASDNAVTGLDLSGLAAGVYVLKVRNGAEHATQQIAIVK